MSRPGYASPPERDKEVWGKARSKATLAIGRLLVGPYALAKMPESLQNNLAVVLAEEIYELLMEVRHLELGLAGKISEAGESYARNKIERLEKERDEWKAKAVHGVQGGG